LITKYVDADGEECKLYQMKELVPTLEGDKNVLLQTIISGQSEIEHFATMIIYNCPNKGNCTAKKEWHYPEDFKDWRDIPQKARCDMCNLEMTPIQVKKEQLRKVLMTEQGESNPLHLTGFIYGNEIQNLQPGTKLNLRGILRSRKRNVKDLTYHRFFDISEYRNSDDKPILPTEEEVQEFKDLDKTEVIKSFAPHIRNMYLIKEGLLLTCLGGVQTETVRGDINTLLLGDPGLAKTQLLKFVTEIVKKSDYVSGKSASGAGLFGGVDNLSDGTRIGKPGSVTMCNGGVAALDEIEKMNDADRTYCHEVMESQKFSLRKIGIDITWEVKVSIIAAGNPKKSRWNPDLSINENINLPDSLLSRFGLVFLVRDIPNKDDDLQIAKHIMKVRRGEITASLDKEQMMKFITYARTLNPVIPDNVDDILVEWWSKLRQEKQINESLSVDIRTYEDLCRLTQAYARLDLLEITSQDHARRAIKMLNDSLQTLGMSTPGERNASIVEHMDKSEFIRHTFSVPVTHSQAIALLMDRPQWFSTEEKAEAEIDKLLHKTNSLLESGGKYTWVS
jgi:replicative DNA helicase Mcm